MDHTIDYYLNQANMRGGNTPLTLAQMNILTQFYTTGVGSQYLATLNSLQATVSGKTTLILFNGTDSNGVKYGNYASVYTQTNSNAYTLDQTAAAQYLDSAQTRTNLVSIQKVIESYELVVIQ